MKIRVRNLGQTIALCMLTVRDQNDVTVEFFDDAEADGFDDDLPIRFGGVEDPKPQIVVKGNPAEIAKEIKAAISEKPEDPYADEQEPADEQPVHEALDALDETAPPEEETPPEEDPDVEVIPSRVKAVGKRQTSSECKAMEDALDVPAKIQTRAAAGVKPFASSSIKSTWPDEDLDSLHVALTERTGGVAADADTGDDADKPEPKPDAPPADSGPGRAQLAADVRELEARILGSSVDRIRHTLKLPLSADKPVSGRTWQAEDLQRLKAALLARPKEPIADPDAEPEPTTETVIDDSDDDEGPPL